MFAPTLLLLALVALSRSQIGLPQYNVGRWENPQYEVVEGITTEETLQLEVPTETPSAAAEDPRPPVGQPETITVPQQRAAEERDASGSQGSALWKMALVVAVLLVCVAGSLSVAYYMCVWRGGRIHYQPQKEASC